MIKPNWAEHLDEHGRMPDWFIAGESGPPKEPEPDFTEFAAEPPDSPQPEVVPEEKRLHQGSGTEFDVSEDFFRGYLNLRARTRSGRSTMEHDYCLSLEEAEALAWSLNHTVQKIKRGHV